MQDKTISLGETVFSLCTRYPEIKGILASLGFTDIIKPGMLQSAGRFMTLPRGAALRRVSLEEIVNRLEAEGFTVRD